MQISQFIILLGLVSVAATCSVYVCSDPELVKYCSCLTIEIQSCTDSVFDQVARESLEDAWRTFKCDGSICLLSLPLFTTATVTSLLHLSLRHV